MSEMKLNELLEQHPIVHECERAFIMNKGVTILHYHGLVVGSFFLVCLWENPKYSLEFAAGLSSGNYPS